MAHHPKPTTIKAPIKGKKRTKTTTSMCITLNAARKSPGKTGACKCAIGSSTRICTGKWTALKCPKPSERAKKTRCQWVPSTWAYFCSWWSARPSSRFCRRVSRVAVAWSSEWSCFLISSLKLRHTHWNERKNTTVVSKIYMREMEKERAYGHFIDFLHYSFV